MLDIDIVLPQALEAFQVSGFEYGSGSGTGSTSFEDYSCFVDGTEIGFHLTYQFVNVDKDKTKCTDYTVSLVDFTNDRVLGYMKIDNEIMYQLDVEQMNIALGLLLRLSRGRKEDVKTIKAISYLVDELDLAKLTQLAEETKRTISMNDSDGETATVTQYALPSLVFTVHSHWPSPFTHYKTPPVIVVTPSKDPGSIQKMFGGG